MYLAVSKKNWWPLSVPRMAYFHNRQKIENNPGFFRVNIFVSFTDNLDINLPCSNSTWELFSLINCVHFPEFYLRTILFTLVSLVSGMRIVFATQNQVRQCGPGIPTSPLQSMYWKFSRDIHFPIYSYCALEADYTTLSVEKMSQIVATFTIQCNLDLVTLLVSKKLSLNHISDVTEPNDFTK